jgi:hypothetical protein
VALLGGLRPALMSTSFAGCVRFIGWSVAPNAWLVLPFECGHGWSFALAYTSMSAIGDLFAPVGLQATVVGLLSSCLGLGNLTATLGWGLVVETVGLRASFGAAAAVFGIAAVAPVLAMAARSPRRRGGGSRAVLGSGVGGRRGASPGEIEKASLVSSLAPSDGPVTGGMESRNHAGLEDWVTDARTGAARNAGAGGGEQQLGALGVRAESAPENEV